MFRDEFESLASHGLLNDSEPETSIWLLLPEHRQLGRTVIPDQELYAQEGCKFVVSDQPTGRQDRANPPAFWFATHFTRRWRLTVIPEYGDVVIRRLSKEGQSGLTSEHRLKNPEGIGSRRELMQHGTWTF